MGRLFVVVVFVAVAAAQVPITRWIDPAGGKPITPKEYDERFGFPKTPLRLGTVRQPKGSKENLVDVVVQSSLYGPLEDVLMRFCDDLEAEGYSVALDTMSSGYPEELRDHLASLLPDIVGAVFVGNLPVKWFRMVEVWDPYEPSDTVIEVFPCDFYFCDLDGIWLDVDDDGIIDEHNRFTNNEAEIWVGRLDPTKLSFGDPVELLRRYFDRDHEYKTGEMPVWAAALSYEYEDWHDFFYYPFSEFEYAEVVRDVFSPSDYLSRVRGRGFELVNIMAHSSPWRHYTGGEGLVFNTDIAALPPRANFYHLFACSGARFVEQDNIGCCYLFFGDRALWVVGSTKTGSIITEVLDDFFEMLQTMCVGDAMRNILSTAADRIPEWHYGLVVLGDPTLRTLYASRGVVSVDTGFAAPNGFPLVTFGAAADVDVVPQDDGAEIFVLDGGDEWLSVHVFSFWGGFVHDNGLADIVAPTTGELALSQNPNDLFFVGEGGVLDIVPFDSGAAASLSRGDGYHSHPFPFSFRGAAGVIYSWLAPALPAPLKDLYLTFRSDSTWEVAPGFDFRITCDRFDEISPYAVLDSSGALWIFWCGLRPAGPQIFCARLCDGTLSEPESLSAGSYPSAVVAGDGTVWLFFVRGGAVCAMRREDTWSEPEVIWSDLAALRPQAIVDETGEPVVIFPAVHSQRNTELWALKRRDDDWLPTRLTFSDCPDLNPDGAVLPDGSLLLAWISGCGGYMQARWGIFEINTKVADRDSVDCKAQKVDIAPTPFSSRVAVRFRGRRLVEVVDLSGRVVASAAGDGSVVFDRLNIPSGVYFIRVEGLGDFPVLHLR